MTKKSKSKNKVTSAAAASESNAHNKNQVNNSTSKAPPQQSPQKVKYSKKEGVENGKSTSPPASSFITDHNNTPRFSSAATTPSLAGIPGVVDDFLAPKFVKVLNLKDHGFEKTPPPPLSEYRNRKEGIKTDGNANKLASPKKEEAEEDASGATTPPTAKKNKRKKNKPVKHASPHQNASYDSEDGREMDDLSQIKNGSAEHGARTSGLSSQEMTSLARHQRIRSSALHYEGNNIVLVSNDDDSSAQYPTTSCYDDYNYVYDDDDPGLSSERPPPPTSSPPRAEESSQSLLDQDDDDDDSGRQGSWSVPGAPHHPPVNYRVSVSQVPSSSSVTYSETDNNNVRSFPTSASGGGSSYFASGGAPSSSSGSFFPSLVTCHSIWDGVNNPCEIKDCSKLATKKCSQCKSVFYCGEEHQRNDWRKHKNECIPYRMEPRFGDISVAVASRGIPAGQKIFDEKPLLVLPLADPENDFLNVMDVPCIRKRVHCSTDPLVENSDADEEPVTCTATKPSCFGCLKSVEFIGPPRYKCSRCQLPLCSYKCHLDTIHQSTECQAICSTGGWKEGQYFCYHLMYLDIEIVRALQMEMIDQIQWERFMQMKLNTRVEAYKNSSRYLRFIENYRELVPISAKLSGYNEELIGNIHAIITALSFRPALTSSFKLLFGTQILFGHDCIPNTFHYLEDSPNGRVSNMTLVTKAALPIMKREIITIDFSPSPFLCYPLRRMVLRNVLSIDNCACKRCTNPTLIGDHTADIRCPRCHHGVICPEKAFKWSNSVWACTTCLEEFSYQTIVKITKDCQEELKGILHEPRPLIVPRLHQFINRRENDLHPGHSIILQAWSYIEGLLKPSLSATRLSGPGPRYPEKTVEEYKLLGDSSTAIDDHLKIIRPGICLERACLLVNKYHMEQVISAKRFDVRYTRRKEYIQELMQCVRTLMEALKIFQMYEGYNRDVSLHIQEATSSLVTTKAFIQHLIVTDNEETKQMRATATANAISTLMGSFN